MQITISRRFRQLQPEILITAKIFNYITTVSVIQNDKFNKFDLQFYFSCVLHFRKLKSIIYMKTIHRLQNCDKKGSDLTCNIHTNGRSE